MSSSGFDGGFLDGSYDAQYYFDLLEAHVPSKTSTDQDIAMFLLVLSSVLLVVFSFVMAVFFIKRNVFQIRARSPILVMLAGACLMASLPLNIMLQTVVLYDATLDVVPFMSVSYFIMVCATCCYGSRTIRLAVMFHPRARKVVPWLTSERNHVVMCLLLGVAALGFPMYDLHHLPDGPFAELVFAARSDKTLWHLSVVCQASVLALWLIIRKTDDIFNISGELRVAIVSQLLVNVAGKLAEDHLSAPYNRWFGKANFAILLVFTVFCVSIVNPILQLWRNPLESSDPRVARALTIRRENASSRALRDCEVPVASTVVPDGESVADWADASSAIWVYDEVAKIPEISAAFDKFSNQALCQESVLFLRAVRSYQSRDGGGWEATADGSGEGGNRAKYAAFTQIVLKFIVNGAPDEVNLSFEDKSAILKVHEAGGAGFYGLEEKEQRFVFAHAYAEVRYVVETNLMERFVSSDGFKAAAHLARLARETPAHAVTLVERGSDDGGRS